MRRRAREGGDFGNRNYRQSSFSAIWARHHNRNQNVVIEEAHPPPSYGDIYVSSLDANPLPSYSTAVQFKSVETNENKLDNNVNQTTQSPIIETINNDINTTIDPNIHTTHDIINSNNSSILNGEINLAFIQEPVLNNDENK